MLEEVVKRNDEIDAEIETLKEQIRKLRAEKKCEFCGKPLRTYNLCANCYARYLRNGTAEYTNIGWGVHQYRKETKVMWQQVFIADTLNGGTDPKEAETYSDIKETANFLLDHLSEREARVIFRLYANGETLQTIGEDLGVTRERVRQIKLTAFRKLRYRYTKHMIKGLLAVQDENAQRQREAQEMAENEKREREDIIKDLERYDIREIDPSVRAYNVCRRNGIDTLGDLYRACVDNEIESLRNCGKKTAYEMREKLMAFYAGECD